MTIKLTVENLGPLSRASATLERFNVIVGKNNSGKSIYCELLRALLGVHNEALQSARREVGRRFAHRFPLRQGVADQTQDKRLDSMLLETLSRYTFNHTVAYRFNVRRRLLNVTESNLGQKLAGMLLDPRRSGRIDFRSDTDSASYTILLTVGPKGRIRVSTSARIETAKFIDDAKRLLRRRLGRDYPAKIVDSGSITRGSRSADYRLVSRNIADVLEDFLYDFTGAGWRPHAVHYIPAGRGGLLEGWKTVASAWTVLGRSAAIRQIELPPFPGPSSIFYESLLSLKFEHGPFAKLVKQKMTSLLDGQVELKTGDRPYGQIVYKFKLANGREREIDVTQASSMVKELAPLFLFLNETVQPGDTLIVEEPESHLHPSKLMELISLLVELSTRQVNVMFTTHSDLSVIRAAQLLARVRAKARPSAQITLFKREVTGTRSKRIELTNPVRLAEFEEVVRELNNEALKLETLVR